MDHPEETVTSFGEGFGRDIQTETEVSHDSSNREVALPDTAEGDLGFAAQFESADMPGPSTQNDARSFYQNCQH